MMVTFVSQCEKKALNRTRRVLDAFADRIGDNTWQTVITQEGLIAVKKLLRNTASKNTAVSCHWIRSRARSELVWVVGNRRKFNSRGIVSVNFTTKEVPMDIDNYKPKQNVAYANTHYQRLDEHLFAVGYVAAEFYKKLVQDQNNQHEKAIFLSGFLHDIGKNEPNFQKYVRDPKKHSKDTDDGQHIDNTNRFSFDDYPRHNELSALIFYVLNQETNNRAIKSLIPHIAHVIYWHHATPFRKDSEKFDKYRKLSDIYFHKTKQQKPSDFYASCISLIQDVESIADQYDNSLPSVCRNLGWEKPIEEFDSDYSLSEEPIPNFKLYSEVNDFESYRKDIRKNALNNLARSCVVTADRLISGLSRSELKDHIDEKTLHHIVDERIQPDSVLDFQITESLNSGIYDQERNKEQAEAAFRLARKEDIAVLAGAAGCGKTKIALEWASQKKAKKLFWICPRVQVCQGIFTDLTEQYLPDSNIEIYTGEFKYTDKWENLTEDDQELTADIIVTTIDQVLNAVITHTKVDLLIEYLNAYVVFDEYHEYINMPAFNLLFAELIGVKRLQANHSTLLVSATPNPYFLENVLDIDEDAVVSVGSFNQCQYKIELVSFNENVRDETNPFYVPQPDQTFVISNTAQTAQISFIHNQTNENSILFHSRFKRSDKKRLFSEVYESFKREGSKQYDILRSGPIVQASLNISCQHMVSEITTPENVLQRLGRLDRFGENIDGVNLLRIAVPEPMIEAKSKNKNKCKCARFLSHNNVFLTTRRWLEFLQDNVVGESFSLTRLYELYTDFYKNIAFQKDLENDLKGSLAKSTKLINKKVTDPIKIKRKSDQNADGVKLSTRSLRGDSVFVQMAKCNLDDYQNPEVLNEYAYKHTADERQPVDSITESLARIEDEDLIHHAAKKHMRIDNTHPAAGIPERKMNIRKKAIAAAARDIDYPVYLSYTPDDLKIVGGDSNQHQHAIFYCVCKKQPIGALTTNRLTNQEENIDE